MCQSHTSNVFWVSKSYFSPLGGQLDRYVDMLLAPNNARCFFWASQSCFTLLGGCLDLCGSNHEPKTIPDSYFGSMSPTWSAQAWSGSWT